MPTATKSTLKEQTTASRLALIETEVLRQLDMQCGIVPPDTTCKLRQDLGLGETQMVGLANALVRQFPDVRAARLFECVTVIELIYAINDSAGI